MGGSGWRGWLTLAVPGALPCCFCLEVEAAVELGLMRCMHS